MVLQGTASSIVHTTGMEHSPTSATGTAWERFKAELTRLGTELNRYAEAIADAGPLTTILEAVKVREQRRDAIRVKLKSLGTPMRAKVRDTSQIRSELVTICRTGVTWPIRALPRHDVYFVRCSSSLRLHAGTATARSTTAKGPGSQAKAHLRAEGEGVTLGTIAGLISANSVVAPTGGGDCFGALRVSASRRDLVRS